MYSRQRYIDKIIPFIDKPLIKVITGMRRSGKSTILKLLTLHLEYMGISSERIIYISMESIDNSSFLDYLELHRFVKEKKKKTKGKLYIFIDEVQEVYCWEKLVNSLLADEDADVYVTGSNSKLLSGEFATLISGRYIELNVYPLTFSEYSFFREHAKEKSVLFNEFLQYGGMPGIHSLYLQKDNVYQYLSAVSDSVILKDVVARNKIRDVGLLSKLLLFVADNIGNTFSGRNIAKYLKNQRRSLSVETIYNYMSYLETALIINSVPRYDLKGKKLLETCEKYYFTDLGFRHVLLGYKEQDINAYLENIVYIELRERGYSVTIGKFDNYEIDFIAKKYDQMIYVQVCYLLADNKVRERETRVLNKIRDNYPKYLLTMDKVPESNINGIIHQYLPDWLSYTLP